MHRALLPALLSSLILVTSAQAQKPIRTVSVTGSEHSDGFEQDVISALTTRLEATTRFSIKGVKQAEWNIGLSCLDMKDLTKSFSGGVCSYVVSYFPEALPGLSTTVVGPAIASSKTSDRLAEVMFENFVTASTEEKLKQYLKTIYDAIQMYEDKKLAKAKP